MKLYVGSRDYKPDGFRTVDIDATYAPDIVADVTDRIPLEDGCVDEIIAGHVLEHIDWPDNFKAIGEFTRILRIGGTLRLSVPDMGSLVRMLLAGDSAFHVMGLVYGIGGRANPFERHRYGFTTGMLVDILETLGFGEFDWWNSPFGDASNGWVPRYENDNTAMSVNVSATKLQEPAVEPGRLYEALVRRPMSDFLSVAAEIADAQDGGDFAAVPRLYQRIHFQLIEARQRIAFLEGELIRRDAE